MVVGLEGSRRGRAHLLGVEDNLAHLKGNLGVVNDKGNLSLNEADDLARWSANLGQGTQST